MSTRTYWLDLFTGRTWDEFKKAGASVSGFRESRWTTVQKIRPGDYLLCDLTGVSRFIGVLEVTSEPFKSSEPIWEDEDFPCRVGVKLVAELTPETAVPVKTLQGTLSIFENLSKPSAWSGRFRGSPARWKASDGEAVVAAIHEAARNPVPRPVDPRKLARRPSGVKGPSGPVTIPGTEEDNGPAVPTTVPTEHTEIQATLLKLGSDMGYDVWVARNDRGRVFKEVKLSDLPRVRKELPRQFDDATNRTIELIDVLWLGGNAIVAAFEVESTTSIYSGLLRMSDLIAMQPNINIPLYLVAPDERREKVFTEVNRPVFSKLSPPLADICRFISFSALRDHIGQAGALIQYLKPESLEEVSESCEIDIS